MNGRIVRAVLIAACAVACVDPAGPGDPRFGQVRLQAVFADGETPADLRLAVDSMRVEIVRDGEGPLVDTVRVYASDETLSWVLDLLEDEEQLPARVVLRGGGDLLYEGDGMLTARAGTLGGADVHDVLVHYMGPPRAMTVTVAPGVATLNAIGATVALTAAAFDGDGAPLDETTFSWSSSAPGVATVDANGVVTATAEGSAEIVAEADGLPGTATVTVEVQAAAGSSTIDADPASIAADGASMSAVTVRLFDAQSNPLGASGGVVTLATTLGTLGPVTDHADGTYTAALTSGTAAGTARVTGALDGAAIGDDAKVEFTTGPAAPNTATISAAPTSVTANGVDAATITVRLFDGNGNPLGTSGGTVTLATTRGTLSAVTDHDDGTYTARLTSTAAGLATVTGTLDGVPITDDATAQFEAGPAAPNTATISAAPTSVTANGVDAATITVRLFDGNGNPLGTSGGTVTLATTLGTLSAVTDHDDGTYTARLTSTAAGLATVTGTLDGVPITDDATAQFEAGPAAPNTATISAAPTSVTADGVEAATITVRLFDGHGNPLTQSGGLVALATDLGTLSAVTDHDDGTYTAQLTSTAAGLATVTGTLDGNPISDDATVQFEAGPAVPNTATISAAPATVTADGIDAATITVRLFDGNGNPLGTSGGTVTLATTLGTLSTVIDHEDGTYTAQLSSTSAGLATVTGTLDGAAINDDATVQFEAGPAAPNTATISAAPTTVTADGVDAATITVRLFDGNGNPLAQSGGLVALATDLGTLSTVTDHDDGTYTATLTSTSTGLATVTGTLDGIPISDDASVTFLADPDIVTAVEVTSATATLTALDATRQFTAVARNGNGDVVPGVSFTWSSSDGAIATIDPATGLAVAVANGTVTIAATADGVTGTASLTVGQRVATLVLTRACPGAAPALAGAMPFGAAAVVLSCDTLFALGDQLQVVAEAFDANGHAVAAPAITWSTDAPAVATVDAAGLVKATGNGTAHITAVSDDATAQVDVVVEQRVESVTVTPSAAVVGARRSTQLVAQAFDANGFAVVGVVFTWTSLHPEIATVDGSGLVTGRADGTATIRATANGVSGDALVTVDE